MTNRCTIVMYHYVRELRRSRYPGIKGLSTEKFRGQLDYLARHYRFVTIEDCLRAIYEDAPLPPNAVLLSFDDGFADHFTNVFPLLHERGIQGCFFPPARAITHHRVLTVHKIHLLLATVVEEELYTAVLQSLADHRQEFRLEDDRHYIEKLALPSRFDGARTCFIKRLLQVELAEELRDRIAGDLFRRYCPEGEVVIARELYMSTDQLRCMARAGMCIGSHGDEHVWLGNAGPEQQAREIDGSLDFLDGLGVPTDRWAIAYPYGSYNESLLRIVREKGCALAMTTAIDVAELTRENALMLPRLDTNDLPASADAPSNAWAARAGQNEAVVSTDA